MKSVVNNLNSKLTNIFTWTQVHLNPKTSKIPCYLLGSACLILGFTLAAQAQMTVELHHGEPGLEDDLIRCAVAGIFELIEGAFGALVMVVAGLGAIVAAAMGAYRAMVSMLVVAVGAFILRALVSLFFGADFMGCDIG